MRGLWDRTQLGLLLVGDCEHITLGTEHSLLSDRRVEFEEAKARRAFCGGSWDFP
jgi:hypothetical protein